MAAADWTRNLRAGVNAPDSLLPPHSSFLAPPSQQGELNAPVFFVLAPLVKDKVDLPALRALGAVHPQGASPVVALFPVLRLSRLAVAPIEVAAKGYGGGLQEYGPDEGNRARQNLAPYLPRTFPSTRASACSPWENSNQAFCLSLTSRSTFPFSSR